MSDHCPQCDTPYCPRHGECQTLDIRAIPKGVDFVLYQVNGQVGGTPVANVGGVEMHGDTLQAAIQAAAAEYKRLCAEEDAARETQDEWEALIFQMQGSCETPERAQELFESSDEFCNYVDQQIFSCTCCGWWCGIEEEASEDHGLDEWTCLQCCEEQA